MSNAKTFPTLYKRTKLGKIQQWTITASETGVGYGCITVEHGITDGKLQTTTKDIKSGKNVGKKNETTPFQQALSESFSKWKKQVDRGYTENSSGVSSVVLPMLAKDFSKTKHKIVYPCCVQPKLNGVRCLAFRRNGKIVLQSRQGKEYTKALPRLVSALETVIKDDIIFDGELYVHGWTFQQIIRAVKKFDLNDSHKIMYWIYDVADSTATFNMRRLYLQTYSTYLPNRLFKFVTTYNAWNEDHVIEWHNTFVKNGFEGVIIRNTDVGYEFNTRSYNLQKYKEFYDKEVLIVGFKQGTGLEAGCVVWHVRDEFGNLFWSRPRGSHEHRRKLYRKAQQYIGCELTIRYQELSEDKVPVFNVGIAIRDYE